jgi:hypothetical protein
MKRIFSWQVIFGAILIALSAMFYFIHYLIFRDAHHILSYFLIDLAFVFIEVLLVTLVLQQLLNYQEKISMLNKMNMVIGAFFSEVGTELLRQFASFDKESHKIADKFSAKTTWTEKDLTLLTKDIKARDHFVHCYDCDLGTLNEQLKGKKSFLLNLLANPNLLEHESFTNLLWAVFHLTEELMGRKKLTGLPEADLHHLEGDMKRVYHLLISEWISYMKHLNRNYPYLFSLAMRTNPFKTNTGIEIRD